MNRLIEVFPNRRHVVLPVVHVESESQAIRNALIAREAGSDGVFLINHSIRSEELLSIHGAVVQEVPGWWVGVNCLGVHPRGVFDLLAPEVSGVWVDNACMDDQVTSRIEAKRIRSAWRRSGWPGLYFGGVAFKYQRPVEDLVGVAERATRYMDVVTTSGRATGQPASREKIATMKHAIGDFPLAIASGLTPENVSDYLDIADCFLVATGINRSWTEFDPVLLRGFMQVVRRAPPPTALPVREGAVQGGSSHGGNEMHEFLTKEFVFPDFGGQRVLIVGAGGGCDIISAYALAKIVEKTRPAQLIYANTKRRVKEPLDEVAPYIYRVPPAIVEPLGGGDLHASTTIDQSVPRGQGGCPLIFCLSHKSSHQRELLASLKRLGHFDWVISVDTGADSIVEDALSGSTGRDKEMLQLLQQLEGEKLHVVVAPGCDGETEADDLARAFSEWERAGKYLGSFPVDEFIPIFEELGLALDSTRTPNIILDAKIGRLEEAADASGVIIPRGIHPTIPEVWLRKCFVFQL
jgi:uncharacterized protein